ncbi:MAG: hypothetical protein ACREPR_19815, partial [Brasilonema sp.]
GWANTNEKSASLRKNRPMKSCSFCIPVDNWGDFSASTLTSYPLLVMRKLPRGAAKLRQIFPGLVKRYALNSSILREAAQRASKRLIVEVR